MGVWVVTGFRYNHRAPIDLSMRRKQQLFEYFRSAAASFQLFRSKNGRVKRRFDRVFVLRTGAVPVRNRSPRCASLLCVRMHTYTQRPTNVRQRDWIFNMCHMSLLQYMQRPIPRARDSSSWICGASRSFGAHTDRCAQQIARQQHDHTATHSVVNHANTEGSLSATPENTHSQMGNRLVNHRAPVS